MTTEYLFDFLHPYYLYSVRVAAYTVAVGVYSKPLEFTTHEDSEENDNTVTIDYFSVVIIIFIVHNNNSIIKINYVNLIPLRPSLSLSPLPPLLHLLSPYTVPGRPVNLVVQTVNSRTLNMSWGPPALDQRNGIIQTYSVNVTTLTDQQAVFNILTNLTSHTLSSLHPYYSYSCSVAAETSAGRGLYVSKSVRLPEDGNSYRDLVYLGEANSIHSLSSRTTFSI